MADKIDVFRDMVARQPDNALARFGLANELLKVGAWADAAAAQLEAYLARYDDEGNGWGRLAEAREALGDAAGARAALDRVEASYRFGHVGMAQELEARRDDLADG